MHAAERIDVWLADPPPGAAPAGTTATTLTDAERSRARAMTPRSAAGFVTGRRLLRAVLGLHLGRVPQEVVLDASCRCGRQHGAVTVLPAGPWVSVSRNGPLVAVVVRDAGPVGVDLASVRQVGAASLENVLPPPCSRHDGAARAEDDRSVAGRWVRTEATLKMLGTGLRHDPASVHLDDSGLAHLDGAAVAKVLDLRGPRLGADAVGAVALGGAAALQPAHSVQVRLRDGGRLLAAPSS